MNKLLVFISHRVDPVRELVGVNGLCAHPVGLRHRSSANVHLVRAQRPSLQALCNPILNTCAMDIHGCLLYNLLARSVCAACAARALYKTNAQPWSLKWL